MGAALHMTELELADWLVERLGTPDDPATDGRLGAALATARDAGAAAWAPLQLSDERFLRHLADRLPEGGTALERLKGVYLTDLYLACACAQGDAVALKLIQERVWDDARLAIRRLVPAEAISEVEQRVRAKLFLEEEGRPPRIAIYIGRGPLAGWLRAVAVREALMFLRSRKQEALAPPDELLELATAESPEQLLMRQQFEQHFRGCFEAALKALPQRERSCLRLHLVAGAGIDQLGQIYGVHRATAARWLARAREGLLTATRACLQQQLQLTPSSLDSLLRLVDSQLDVSLQRLLDQGS